MGLAAASLHERHDASGYRRHRPETTVLYQVVEQHWPAFRERAEQAGGLPKLVVREMEEYLCCGRLEHGGLRIACKDCGFERLVAFSCKRRGFCPSCLSRRMTDVAVHLCERVLPEVRVRQWVCSLPWRLRVLLGYDKKVCAAVLGAFVGELRRSLRRRARERFALAPKADVLTGAVTFVQRFDSGLRLNVHFHTLCLDGVYVREGAGAPLVFHPLPEPTVAEVEDVARRTAERALAILVRHGRSPEGEGESPLANEPALASLATASARGLDVLGARAGQPTLRILDPAATRPDEPVAEVAGFNVHAKVVVDGRDRVRLERVCRYLGRPPIAQERLERLADGRIRYTMKKPWRDGTCALVFEPLDLLARLCAMVPPPGFHMIRFHGVLAAHAAARAEVVPKVDPSMEPKTDAVRVAQQLALFADDAANEPREPSRKPWAWLLKHVFAVDVTVCPECKGAMRWLEVATTPEAIARLLADERQAARAPPPTDPPSPPPALRRRRAPLGQLDLDLGG